MTGGLAVPQGAAPEDVTPSRAGYGPFLPFPLFIHELQATYQGFYSLFQRCS